MQQFKRKKKQCFFLVSLQIIYIQIQKYEIVFEKLYVLSKTCSNRSHYSVGYDITFNLLFVQIIILNIHIYKFKLKQMSRKTILYPVELKH